MTSHTRMLAVPFAITTRFGWIAAALSGTLALETRAQAAGEAAAVMATRIPVAPVIDGRADDAAWSSGPVTDQFRMFAPHEGGDPTVRTEVRVRYDDRALYFLIRAFDPHPEGIVRRVARRDTVDPNADIAVVFLDPLHDGRTGYEFGVTASGVKIDAALTDDGVEDYSWDGVWECATRIDSLGWMAELAIPFRELRFTERRAPVFGIFVGRWVGRSGERASVPQYRRTKAGLSSQMGILGGLRDLPASSMFSATPYTLGRARNLAPDGTRHASVEARSAAGVDIKWLPRPSVSVDATVNPDFGQVEADPAAVNLTGLEIFQDERRPFFVEGAGLLTFPLAADGAAQLFYSRRIGRRPALLDTFGAPDSPTETSILGAAKVTAHVGAATSLAVLGATTERVDGRANGDGHYVLEPRGSDLVARLERNFRDGRSSFGVMYTGSSRDASDSIAASFLPSSARAAAFTTQHQTNDGAYQVRGWLAASDVQGDVSAISRLQLSPVHAFQRPDDSVAFDPTRRALAGSALYASAGKVGGGLTRFSASYRRIAPEFDVNELGYLTTSGLQSVTASVGLNQARAGEIAHVPFRRANASLTYSGDWSTNGLPFQRSVSVAGELQLSDLSDVQATLKQQLPGALCTVACTRGGPALVDPPRFTFAVNYTGDPRRTVVPHIDAEYDRDDEGRSHGYGAQLDATWRVRSNFDVWLAAYAFDARYATFFYRVFGDAASDTAHYTVARLDNPTRSLTSRINYTMTSTLTLQWYGQAYISRGAYDDVRGLANPRAADWDARFHPYADSSVRARPGGIDFKQLRSNTVLRWEYRPGSALFVVWSQGRDVQGESPAHVGLWPGADLHQLFATRPQNLVTVKLSYWMSR